MSNREVEGFENWRVRSLISGLQLLAVSGCGESSTEIDGVWVDVIVGCADPACLQCASGGGTSPLRAATGGVVAAPTRGPGGGLPRRGAWSSDAPTAPPSEDRADSVRPVLVS